MANFKSATARSAETTGSYQLQRQLAQKGLALPRVSLRRDRPGRLTLPAFHAGGSASPSSAKYDKINTSSQNLLLTASPLGLDRVIRGPCGAGFARLADTDDAATALNEGSVTEVKNKDVKRKGRN